MTTKKRSAPMKECPECKKEVHARKATCDCGHVFVAKQKPAKKSAKPQANTDSEEFAVPTISAVKDAIGARIELLEHEIEKLKEIQSFYT